MIHWILWDVLSWRAEELIRQIDEIIAAQQMGWTAGSLWGQRKLSVLEALKKLLPHQAFTGGL